MDKRIIAIILGVLFAAFAWWFFMEREVAPPEGEDVALNTSLDKVSMHKQA